MHKKKSDKNSIAKIHATSLPVQIYQTLSNLQCRKPSLKKNNIDLHRRQSELEIYEHTMGISSLGVHSSTSSQIPYRLSNFLSSSINWSWSSSAVVCWYSSPISNSRLDSIGWASFSKLCRTQHVFFLQWVTYLKT